MPASITLSNLAWSTPDGRTLFSGLELTFGPERTGLVGRNGVGKTTLLHLIAGTLPPTAGTVRTSGRLAFLWQDVAPRPGETIAGLFGGSEALALLTKAESGEASVDELAAADWSLEARIASALARVGLVAEPTTPLASLSGGQASRAALAALLFAEPDFLILDEPTNNLDRSGRRAVIDLLGGWHGGAIVVSHDRELLDTMDAIVELTTLGATRFGGNWSHYRERKVRELAAAERERAHAEKQVEITARRAQDRAERQARRDRGGRKKGARGDMPAILAGTLKRRAEESAAAGARLAERQMRASGEAAAARARIEVLQPFSVDLAPTSLAQGRIVVSVQDLVVGHVPGHPVLNGLSFTITGPERVALTGPNGSGKTTLVSVLAGHLAPFGGSAVVHTPFALLDQRVSILDRSLSIRQNFRNLNPESDENACRAALARFRFRADAALQTVGTLSGGEMLRAGLACALGGLHPPPLLILDEPTNHLDVESVETVETGLAGYDGAMLVVSHDIAFLEQIGVHRHVALR